MLTPLTPDLKAEAITLLCEGFPERDAAFWDRGLTRLFAWPGNHATRRPIGYLWREGGKAEGVILTPATEHIDDDGQCRILVNVSSWYVRPALRWKAPMMLRALFRDADPIFTDLTPTPDVQKMLPAFGFHPVNRGVWLQPLPLLALRPASRVRIRPWRAGQRPAGAVPGDDLIALHEAWGCLPLEIDTGDLRQLVVLKPFRLRGIPAIRTVFVEHHAAFTAARPALARFLLKRGFLVLQSECRGEACRPGWFRERGIWFARGNRFAKGSSQFGSELCLLDL